MLPALQVLAVGLVRRTWLVALATIAVCAVFAARAVAAFAGPELEANSPSAAVVASAASSAVPDRATARAKIDGDVLVERNIFCSSCVPRSEPGPASSSPARYTGQPATLIATTLGKQPYATVRVIATEAQGVWTIGETIPGVGNVVRIGGSSIDVVDTAGNTGTISLIDVPKPGGGDAAAATAKPATAPASPFEGRIEKLTDTSYRVDRELIRELVMGTTQAKGVRALPVMEKGEIKGLKLTGIKPDSVAAAVGIKSGDTFDSIDGVKIKNAQQLLDLYTKLDNVSAVELAGTRAGKPLVLQFQLR